MPSPNENLSVQQASDLLGVSPSTFKRLCETHNVEITRTPGGHRRVDRLVLQELAAKIWQSHRPKSANLPTVDCILDDLLNMRATDCVARITHAASCDEKLIAAVEDTLIATLWRIGELCSEGEIDVYQVHICANTASHVIDVLSSMLPACRKNAACAVGGCLAPGLETIASKCVALSLRSIGVRAFDLGANIPVSSLAKAARELDAKIVWTTYTHHTEATAYVADHRQLSEELPDDVRIVVGGGAISPSLRRTIQWCEYYETMSQMVAVLQQQAAN